MKQKSEFIIKIAFVYSSAALYLWNDDDRTCMFLFLLYTSATKKWKNSVKFTWTGDVLLCGKCRSSLRKFYTKETMTGLDELILSRGQSMLNKEMTGNT